MADEVSAERAVHKTLCMLRLLPPSRSLQITPWFTMYVDVCYSFALASS